MDLTYKQSHAFCKDITSHHAKSFYFASRLLPAKKRKAAYAIYAFCRFADDGVDSLTSPGAKQTHLKKCEAILERVYEHRRHEFTLPLEPAFEQAVSRYEIPRQLFTDLLTGLVLESHFKQPENEAELLTYCYHVAGCLGLVMTHVFGTSQPAREEAIALGNAVQLTNIARDLKEDSLLGRVYLPTSWLQEAELTASDVLSLSQNPDKRALEKVWSLELRLISMADELYKKAWTGLPLVTNDGSRFCVAMMALTYGSILHKIQRKGLGALTHRQSLSWLEKIMALPRAYGM